MTNSFVFGGMPVELGDLATMDYSHDQIHEGEMFMARVYAGTLAVSGTLSLHVNAGTVEPHLYWDIATGGSAELRITEGGTVTGGTAVIIRNMNRNNAGTCTATVVHSGTLTGGTVIDNAFLLSGLAPSARANNEIVALPSKTTSIQVVNLGAAYPASIRVTFYEENE